MVDITKLDVKCKSCESLVNPERPVYKYHFSIGAALIFGLIGAIIGSVIGIATAGVGAPAIVPLGLIGLIGGYMTGDFASRVHDGFTCPNCESGFGSGLLPWR